MHVLNIWDQEELHNVAEDVIVGLRYLRYLFDDKGNDLTFQLSREERHLLLEKMIANEKTDYLNFDANEELHRLSFHDALYMPLDEIKEKYLKDVLLIARGILRKDTTSFGYLSVVSDEVPDSYLDDLLALRWRENLKLWTIQWDKDFARNDSEH